MPRFELYGAASCPHTREMREWLEFRGCDYIEYDVELDREAAARMFALTGARLVPVLMEEGKVLQSGWQGRGCIVG